MLEVKLSGSALGDCSVLYFLENYVWFCQQEQNGLEERAKILYYII